MALIEKNTKLEESEHLKYTVIAFYCLAMILFGFAVDTPSQIIKGMLDIINSPDTLITDYMMVGGIGAAFINAGILALLILYIYKRMGINLTGAATASIFTIAGFGLFGKNLYNVWPIIMGVWLYSKLKKESFRNNILIAAFGTALSPIVSEVTFAMGFDLVPGIILGIIMGILVGLLLPSLARYFVGIHQGYNLYNIGFTAGFIGTVIMSLLRVFGLTLKGEFIWSYGRPPVLMIGGLVFFSSMIVLGFLISPAPIKKLQAILKNSGRLVTDFIIISGFGATLINMGLLGLLGFAYVILVKGDLNGPTIGGILTMAGFGAFGTHPRNALPIMAGVYIIGRLSIWTVNSPGVILAALFGTTLAPIAGAFGWMAGIIAGIIHLAIVMNVGYLHGGLNLYNNGFSGGIVATILLPVLEVIRRNRDE